MKKLILAVLVSACFAPAFVTAANLGDDCGGNYSAAVLKDLDAFGKSVDDARRKETDLANEAAKTIKTPKVDVRALSCVDKYTKFKVVVAYPWPSIDMLFDTLKNMACRVVDDKVNEMTSGLNLNQNLPYGLGNAGIGVGAGGNGGGYGGSNSGGNVYDSGSSGLSVGTQNRNQDISGRVLTGIENRFR